MVFGTEELRKNDPWASDRRCVVVTALQALSPAWLLLTLCLFLLVEN